MKTLEAKARLSRERRCTSRSSSRHRTSRYSLITRVRRAAVLFRALRRCQIIPAGLCHVHAGLRVRTCPCRRYRIHWLAIRCSSQLNRGTAKMQFQRFRRATTKSRCNVTKMCTGNPSNPAVFFYFTGICYFKQKFTWFTCISDELRKM